MQRFNKVLCIVFILLHKTAGVGLLFLLAFGLGAAFEEKYPHYLSRNCIFWGLLMFVCAVTKGITTIYLKKYSKQLETNGKIED